jgi:thiosulfate reductase / polysulfide reductase chain A
MNRTGPRDSGEWKMVTWNEALAYVANRLKEIIKQHGGQSVIFWERTNLKTHNSKTFMKAIGSPKHFTHDALGKSSRNTSCRNLTSFTNAQVEMDHANIPWGR